MKKFLSIILVLSLILSFTVCGRGSLNYVIENYTSFRGVVTEFVKDEYIVVDCSEAEDINEEYDIITVSLDVEYDDSMTHFDIGDEVAVYYETVYTDENGVNRLETVYAVLLIEPANREQNNKS